MMRILLFTLIFILLTILTQVGGVLFAISIVISRKIKFKLKLKQLIIFVCIYLISTFLLIPNISPFFGRVSLPNSESVKPATFLTILLNRNYVNPEFYKVIRKIEKDLSDSKIKLTYLDANFPFINGFPMLPHLSHNDGKKLDVSLIYENANGEIVDKQKSNSGYGNFENPKPNEVNQTKKCKSKGYFQYDYPKYLTFGTKNKNLNFSIKGTKFLVLKILENKEIQKLFLEPHLKNRLKLNDSRIRFHGCKAVRHDDHIHFQIK
jgi:hypothetical protein